MVLAYCSPCNPAVSLPGLAKFILAAMLRSPRLLIAGDFNIHAELELFGLALEFMGAMTAMNLSQHVICPTHSAGHTLDLVFSTAKMDSDLRVGTVNSHPLSWTDHFLLRFNLSVATPLPWGEWTHENGPSSQAS